MINLELLNELKNRFETDQKYINNKDIEKFEEICSNHTLWLKEQISHYGWISSNLVSEQGELFSWLIVQHSEDLHFQKECLDLLKKLPLTNERKGHIAYLTDKILVKEHKEQLYGTQFSDKKPLPIKNIKNLDKRREKLSLGKFEEYSQFMTNGNKQ